jgi:hypothetical protein
VSGMFWSILDINWNICDVQPYRWHPWFSPPWCSYPLLVPYHAESGLTSVPKTSRWKRLCIRASTHSACSLGSVYLREGSHHTARTLRQSYGEAYVERELRFWSTTQWVRQLRSGSSSPSRAFGWCSTNQHLTVFSWKNSQMEYPWIPNS